MHTEQVQSVTPGDLAQWTGMTPRFFRNEIAAGELRASKFGVEWRIPNAEARRYLLDKGWPLPDSLRIA